MKGYLSLILLAVVLRVPIQVWISIPEPERAQIKSQTLVEEMRNLAQKGFCKFKFYEKVENWNWELHVEPVEEYRI